jgi:hypothetical protein
MIGSITQAQQAMHITKCDETAPPISPPDAQQLAWAKDVARRGYQSEPLDRADAERILAYAGIDASTLSPDVEADSAPPGARALADALRRREAGDAADDDGPGDPDAAKSFTERGITAGPGEPLDPARPAQPAAYDRSYVAEGHAAESPMAAPPTQNPQPNWPTGVPVPVRLGDVPVVGHVSASIAASLSMPSPSER